MKPSILTRVNLPRQGFAPPASRWLFLEAGLVGATLVLLTCLLLSSSASGAASQGLELGAVGSVLAAQQQGQNVELVGQIDGASYLGAADNSPEMADQHGAPARPGESLSAAAASWNDGGLDGRYITSLAVGTGQFNVVYAGTESGLFKSADGAATWAKTNFPDTRVRVIQVAPGSAQTVYVGTDDGVYKSQDGGNAWTRKGLSGARVNTLAIDPGNPRVVYAGAGWPNQEALGEVVGVFKTTDGGENWQSKLSAGLDAVTALNVAFSSARVYAGVYSAAGNSVSGQAPSDAKGEIIHAGSGRCGQVWLQDWSGNWTKVEPEAPAGRCWLGEVRDIGTVDADSRVYVATDSGLMRWNGSTWTKLPGLPTDDIAALAVNPASDDRYAGISGQGVFLHDTWDDSFTWSPVSEGLRSLSITKLAFSAPGRPSILYAGTADAGIWTKRGLSSDWFGKYRYDSGALTSMEDYVSFQNKGASGNVTFTVAATSDRGRYVGPYEAYTEIATGTIYLDGREKEVLLAWTGQAGDWCSPSHFCFGGWARTITVTAPTGFNRAVMVSKSGDASHYFQRPYSFTSPLSFGIPARAPMVRLWIPLALKESSGAW